MLNIIQIPVLEDNYIYLLHNINNNMVACIDPSLAQPVLDIIQKLGAKLDIIFLTHHHWDHVGGVAELKQATGCKVYCSEYDKNRIDNIDEALNEGDQIYFGSYQAKILATPGHTLGHICYFFPEQKLLFAGDTLFANGCGRLFEGTAEQMWVSLQKLKQLPDSTMVYCAHEYTLKNTEFALKLDTENAILQKRYADFQELRENGNSTIPVLLADEKATNPFLRADNLDIFTELRLRKDSF